MIVIKISLYLPVYEELFQPSSCIMRLRIVTWPRYNNGVPVFRHTMSLFNRILAPMIYKS